MHLTPFEKQFEIQNDDGKLVSRPDMFFPPRLAVYADGADYHSSPEQQPRDNRIRQRVPELGYKVLAFSGHRIAGDIGGCIREIVNVIEG